MESILKVSNIVLQLRIGYNDIRVEVVMQEKEWEELGISNDFLFGKVMQDPELCKELLEVILNVPIERVEYPELQKTIDIAQDARSVRLDVYVRDGHDTVYDIEMQTVHEEGLPKRSRYYQGMIDLASIEKGELYKNLNRSYVIFICTFDAFGRGESIYTFENMCREVPGLPLGDETYKIFLNAKGASQDVSAELQAFLQYVAGKKSDSPFVKRLEKAVVAAKKNKEWRHEFMTLHMRDLENIEKGREEGRQEGLLEGRREGHQEGHQEGLLEGRQETTVRVYQELGMTKAATLEVVKRDFSLNDENALKVLERYWKE